MSKIESMKCGEFPPKPAQRAAFNVGVVTADREADTVFHGRVRLVLVFDFEQAVELQRCVIAQMQSKFVGDECLQIELEPGVLELFANREEPKGVKHWIRAFPETKSAEQRGFHCGAMFDPLNATSYRDQVTCDRCSEAAIQQASEAECSEDPEICDCSHHENARRAEATHTAP